MIYTDTSLINIPAYEPILLPFNNETNVIIGKSDLPEDLLRSSNRDLGLRNHNTRDTLAMQN